MKLLGVDITVKRGIPYNEKMTAAATAAVRTVVKDDKKAVAIRSGLEEAIWTWMILKFFTNANVEGLTPEQMMDLHDRLENDAGWYELNEYISASASVVASIYENTCDMLKKQIESVEVANGYGGIIDAFMSRSNPAEDIAEAKQFNEWMLNVMEQANKNKAKEEIGKLPGLNDMLKNGVVSFGKKKI